LIPRKGFLFQSNLLSRHSDQILQGSRGRGIVCRARPAGDDITNLPGVCENFARPHAELHIIGRNQVTSDLPEWRFDKGKPLPEYNGLTIDQRTRGMGGRISSCGEENLLKLEKGPLLWTRHLRPRVLPLHLQSGIPRDVRDRFRRQYKASLAKGLWEKAYAASNDDEFFAESCAMWYFGTHGADLHMTGSKTGQWTGTASKPTTLTPWRCLMNSSAGRIEISRQSRLAPIPSEFEDDPGPPALRCHATITIRSQTNAAFHKSAHVRNLSWRRINSLA